VALGFQCQGKNVVAPAYSRDHLVSIEHAWLQRPAVMVTSRDCWQCGL